MWLPLKSPHLHSCHQIVPKLLTGADGGNFLRIKCKEWGGGMGREGLLAFQSGIHKCQACRREEWTCGQRRRRPHCPPRCLRAPQRCTMLTPTPLSPSRPRRRSAPLQPAVKTLTHRLPRRKKHVERDEEERAM